MTKTKIPTTAPSGLDYAKCKRTELDVFYKQRLHKDVPKGVNKAELIQMLRRIDQYPGKFRFLDLPAEMRNAVYKEVLVIPRAGSRRQGGAYQPAVLRVSRQVHSESRGILYGENEPEVFITANDRPSKYLARERQCSIPLLSKKPHTDRVTSRENFHLWHGATKSLRFEHLTRFHCITVCVDIGREEDSALAPKLLIAVNQLLYSLCDFLAPGPQKRTVTLKLDTQIHLTTHQALYEALWPITRLSTATIHFTGVPQEVQQLLRTNRTTWNRSQSLLDQLSQAYGRAEGIRIQLRKLGAEKRDLVRNEVKAWEEVYRSIVGANNHTQMMDLPTEKKLRRNIAKIEQLPDGELADLLAANIDESIKDMEKLSASLKAIRDHK